VRGVKGDKLRSGGDQRRVLSILGRDERRFCAIIIIMKMRMKANNLLLGY